MKPISQKTLRDADWQLVYQYEGDISFKTFACAALPGITITHETGSRGRRKRTIYTVHSEHGPRKTDSLIQAVRNYNEESQKDAKSRRPAPGSPESIGRPQTRGTGI